MTDNKACVLVDLTKCVGCGGCTVACKMWNERSFESGNAHGFGAELSEDNWTVVSYHEAKQQGKDVLRFTKRQCMHCLEPACVSVCFAKAIRVSENGAVVYDPKKCVGCRYCMLGCPFDVPKYEWNKVFPSIMKCTFCVSKLEKGEMPSCVSVCPSGALTFGERDDLLRKAKAAIAGNKKYVNHIYGETEAGGTRWLYISDVEFEKLGFPQNVPEEAVPGILHKYSRWKPGVFIGAAALFGGLGFYTKRRLEIEKMNRETEEEADV